MKFPWLVPILLVAGCTSRESRIESALIQAGLPAAMAACMAPPLARDLSNDQLRRLAEVAKSGRTTTWNGTESLRRLADGLDPLTIGIMARTSAGCLFS